MDRQKTSEKDGDGWWRQGGEGGWLLTDLDNSRMECRVLGEHVDAG